jgi:hypothetical protein
MNGIIKAFIVIFVLGFSLNGAHLQPVMQSNVQQGVELFFSARFEEAVQILQTAVINGNLTPAQLFTAYLYIAFSRIRQNAENETIRLNLEAAIKADPSQKLDAIKTPPDLYEQFENLRKNILARLAVFSNPPAASVLLMAPKQGKVINGSTPGVFTDLLAGEYQLVVARDGYNTASQTVTLMPGKQDTVVFELIQKKSIINRVNKRWLAWGGGGLVLTTAILASIPWSKEEEKPKTQPDLPLPPNRAGKP